MRSKTEYSARHRTLRRHRKDWLSIVGTVGRSGAAHSGAAAMKTSLYCSGLAPIHPMKQNTPPHKAGQQIADAPSEPKWKDWFPPRNQIREWCFHCYCCLIQWCGMAQRSSSCRIEKSTPGRLRATWWSVLLKYLRCSHLVWCCSSSTVNRISAIRSHVWNQESRCCSPLLGNLSTIRNGNYYCLYWHFLHCHFLSHYYY